MRSFDVLCLVPLLSFHVVLAQVAPANTDSHRVMRFREYLTQEGVGSSIDSITQALSNPNPKVRSAAAFTLAEEEGKASIAPVENALTLESVPIVAVQLSEVLLGLDDPLGKARLEQFCSDARTPTAISSLAMTYLINRDQGEGCVSSAIARLNDPSDGQHQSELLLLLASAYSKASEMDRNVIISTAEKQLKDADSYNRIIASQVLARVSPVRASKTLKELSHPSLIRMYARV